MSSKSSRRQAPNRRRRQRPQSGTGTAHPGKHWKLTLLVATGSMAVAAFLVFKFTRDSEDNISSRSSPDAAQDNGTSRPAAGHSKQGLQAVNGRVSRGTELLA